MILYPLKAGGGRWEALPQSSKTVGYTNILDEIWNKGKSAFLLKNVQILEKLMENYFLQITK